MTDISWADFGTTGFAGVHDLGDIFPTGYDPIGLEAFLSQASYTGAPGTGNPDLDLIVVPEPATLGLAVLGSLGLAALRRRRK